MESDFRTIRKRNEKDLWHRLDKIYPKMPPTDRKAVHRLLSIEFSGTIGSSTLNFLPITIRDYVQDRYTQFKSLNIHNRQNREAIAKVNQKVEKTLAFWRGEEQCPEFQWHIHRGRPAHYSTPEAAIDETGNINEQYSADHRTERNQPTPSARARARYGGPCLIRRVGARQPRPKGGRGT